MVATIPTLSSHQLRTIAATLIIPQGQQMPPGTAKQSGTGTGASRGLTIVVPGRLQTHLLRAGQPLGLTVLHHPGIIVHIVTVALDLHHTDPPSHPQPAKGR